LMRINLPNDGDSRKLAERCLKALDLRFSDGVVGVDLTTFNAARICKLYGTLACKGDSTPERPHRVARILEAPEDLVVAPRVLQGNGAIAAGCHHNGCADKDWHALRDVYEPGWRERRSGKGAGAENQTGETDLGNARRLIKHHVGHLRYVRAWKKWLYWDGMR